MLVYLQKNVGRYQNVQPDLQCNIIYQTIARNISHERQLMRLIQILSAPDEFSYELHCNLCNAVVTDPVDHIVFRCTQLNLLRERMWAA